MITRVLATLTCALLLTACGGNAVTRGTLARTGATGARSAEAPAQVTPAPVTVTPGVATAIAILRPDGVRTSFQLTATLDGKPLLVGYQGMPGAYTILSATLAGVALDPAGRKAAAGALKAAAESAGRQAMVVEEVAEALAG